MYTVCACLLNYFHFKMSSLFQVVSQKKKKKKKFYMYMIFTVQVLYNVYRIMFTEKYRSMNNQSTLFT